MESIPVAEDVLLQPWGSEYPGTREEVQKCSVLHEPEREPPTDFVLWSLFNTIFLNYFCCLGFLALIFSVKSRDRKMVGDFEGAKHYGATAKQLNIIVSVLLGLCVAATILCLCLYLRF